MQDHNLALLERQAARTARSRDVYAPLTTTSPGALTRQGRGSRPDTSGNTAVSAAEPHTVAWTVDQIETETLSDDDRDASVNTLATLINAWNETRRET